MIWKGTKPWKIPPEAERFLSCQEQVRVQRASFVPHSLLSTRTIQDTSAKSFTCTYVSGNIPDKKELLLKSCGFNCEGF